MLTFDKLLPMRRADVAKFEPAAALDCDPVALMQAEVARVRKESRPPRVHGPRWHIRGIEDIYRLRVWLDTMASALGYVSYEVSYEKGCEHLAGLIGELNRKA